MARALLRSLVPALGSALVLALAAVAVGALWLRTGAGRAFLARRVEAIAGATLGATVSVESVGGPLLLGVALEGVEVRHRDRVAARIPRVRARWRPWDLLGKRRTIDRLVLTAPRLDLDAMPRLPGGDGALLVRALSVHEGEVTRGSLHLEGVELRGSLRAGASGGRATVQALTGKLVEKGGVVREVSAAGRVRWDAARLELVDLVATLDGFRFEGGGSVGRHGPLGSRDARIDADRVVIAPFEVRRRFPLARPARALEITGRARGRLDDLRLEAEAPLGGGRVLARGRIAVAAGLVRSLRLVLDDAALETLVPELESLRVSGEAELRGAPGSLELVVRDGHGRFGGVPFREVALRARAGGRRDIVVEEARASLPGGRLAASGAVSLDGGLRLSLEVKVLDGGKLPVVPSWQRALLSVARPLGGAVTLRGTVRRPEGRGHALSVRMAPTLARTSPSTQELLPLP